MNSLATHLDGKRLVEELATFDIGIELHDSAGWSNVGMALKALHEQRIRDQVDPPRNGDRPWAFARIYGIFHAVGAVFREMNQVCHDRFGDDFWHGLRGLAVSSRERAVISFASQVVVMPRMAAVAAWDALGDKGLHYRVNGARFREPRSDFWVVEVRDTLVRGIKRLEKTYARAGARRRWHQLILSTETDRWILVAKGRDGKTTSVSLSPAEAAVIAYLTANKRERSADFQATELLTAIAYVPRKPHSADAEGIDGTVADRRSHTKAREAVRQVICATNRRLQKYLGRPPVGERWILLQPGIGYQLCNAVRWQLSVTK